MQNLANISPMEIAVVGSALLLLVVGPALVAWSDARRRRVLAARPDWYVQPAQQAPAVEPAAAWRGDEPSEGAAADPQVGEALGAIGAPFPDTSSGDAQPAASAAVPLSSAHFESEAAPPTPSAPPALVLEPLDAPARCRFRLGDLHAARLPDWPPAAIAQDPVRRQSWREAEAVAEQHQASIRGATICSPYPARSTCLGVADADAARASLRYLLFPVSWPVSQNQAVAQAVFEIDRSSGAVRGWVDALQSHELSQENRSEIRECGGDV